jgi:hypothetical protein
MMSYYNHYQRINVGAYTPKVEIRHLAFLVLFDTLPDFIDYVLWSLTVEQNVTGSNQ